jgi:hypothetical protein
MGMGVVAVGGGAEQESLLGGKGGVAPCFVIISHIPREQSAVPLTLMLH